MLCVALAIMVVVGATGVPVALAAGQHMLQPRVPIDQLEEARALTSPLPDLPDTIEKGKALYHGKGTSFNCHGKDGDGDVVMAKMLDPAPRNFQQHGFWRHRTEGEIFWVIKHGSPGTSMVGFAGQLTDEEIWSIIQYERTFSLHSRRGMRGMGGRGPMDHMGPQGGMGHGRMGRGDEAGSEAPSQEDDEKTPSPR
ncbi:MAG: c-type cytochrome [Nitrospira defluvii]|nr:c-type cytochrome [Nitrospira defluvii]